MLHRSNTNAATPTTGKLDDMSDGTSYGMSFNFSPSLSLFILLVEITFKHGNYLVNFQSWWHRQFTKAGQPPVDIQPWSRGGSCRMIS